jgi:fibronectin-binding autotransporter adhesin
MDVQGAGTSSATAANLNLTGGSLTIGNSSSSGAFKVGDTSTAAHGGYLTMTGGTLTYLGTDGLLAANNAAGNLGVINISGGTANLSGVTLNAGNSSTANSTLTVEGATPPTLYLGSAGLVANPASSGTVSVTFSNAIIGAIADWSSSAPITLAGNTTIQAADASSAAHNITLSGVLSGSTGGLTKTGNGTLTLSGPNTYSGATTVSAGAMIVNGNDASAGGAVTVTNATLGGIGTIGGPTTLQPNAILAAGNGGIGTVSFSGALTLNAASTNTFVVTTAGGASNKVAVAGTLTPNSSVIKVTSGTALLPGTNTLFTYGTVSGTFASTPVFDVAPVHPVSIVDNGAGQINLVVPNAAPVAASFTLGVTIGIPSTMKIVGGKYTPTDADGDALLITAAGGCTNGTVTTDGTNVTYLATNGVADSFSYTVSDGYGGTASQTVNVTISPAGEGFNQLNARVVDGNEVLTYFGIPGYKYALEWTHDLAPPVVWTPLVTNTAASNGNLPFTNAPSGGADFYRTRYVP